MNDETVGAIVKKVEDDMLRTYRLWFEHARKCAVGCKRVSRAQDGCEDGRELWGVYRLTRIGRTS
ncbi:hypothetical protein [Streptomyces sp. AK08-02]|uniref:hypothetical protein n=1 Tax=Streptomyces sp. AK08-02 TaxID=3028654 RepID=UPI0029BD8D52|nr:hypothetical protein [Streptomyces sp. AK08-02]MDX3752428.1 hypothetical protein [Streptomyces sp. AK08-02]